MDYLPLFLVEPAFCVTFEVDITNPWVTYTHISHINSGKKDNAAPLFDWGKYSEKEKFFDELLWSC